MSQHGTVFAVPQLPGGVSVVSIADRAIPHDYFAFHRAGIAYRIEDRTFFDEASHLFGIERLHYVRQFGLLAGPGYPYKRALYRHTRGRHSYDVTVIALLIADRIGLSDAERNVIRLAAFTHDALTPVWSDRVKFLDPAGLDEDQHYSQLLERPKIRRFLDHHGISATALFATIKGDGLTGSVLDVADKCAYVAQDVDVHLAFNVDVDDPIRVYLSRYPNACMIWDTAILAGGRVAFNHPRRLAQFLTVRALNFRHIYHHPRTRVSEEVVATTTLERLYAAGEITNEDLLRMTDADLEVRLSMEPECTGYTWKDGTFRTCRHIPFDTMDEAKAYIPQLQALGVKRIQFLYEGALFKPGTHLLVQSPDGVVTYASAFPPEAKRIHATGVSICRIALLLDDREYRAKHLPLALNA